MKRTSRLTSFFLAFVMVVTTFVGIIPPLEVSAATTETTYVKRYTVLVLETANPISFSQNGTKIYTADTALEYVKKASQNFVENIGKAEGNNYVAVISYNASASVVSDFTDDMDMISQKIDNLKADSGKNISAGISKAQELLSAISDDDAIKNIVLCTTGHTRNGDYSYEGYFDENSAGSEWYNSGTNIHLYAYANHAIETAKKAEKDANIYVLGLFQTMNDMPDEGADVVELFVSTAKALASQESNYHNIDDINNIEFVFEEIASDIINPLYITLSCEKIEDIIPVKIDDITTVYHGRYVYRITAHIENRDAKVARNVECSFVCPSEAIPLDKMLYTTEKSIKEIGDIPAGESVSVTWNMEIEHPEENFSAIYEVNAKAENTLLTQSIGSVFVNEFSSQKINKMLKGVDTWRFSNSSKYFGSNSAEGYYITEDDLDALSNLDSETEEAIREIARRSWRGSCYGMSTVAVLTKMGIIDPSNIQSDAETLHSIKKVNNDDVESFINFYHLQQYLTIHQDSRAEYQALSSAERLALLSKYAEETNSGGAPVLLEFHFYQLDKNGERMRDANDDLIISGHAVIAYNVVEGFWEWDGISYDHKIEIYDPNFPDGTWFDKEHLYYKEGTAQWTIPQYCNYLDAWLGFASNNIQEIDLINHYTASENVAFYLTVLDNTQMMIEHGDQIIKIDGNVSDGDIVPVVNVGTIADGINNSSITYIFPCEDSDSYTVKPVNAEDNIEHIMNTPNGTIITNASNMEGITYKNDGGVMLIGDDIEYDIIVVLDETNESDWTSLTIKGNNADNIELSYVDQGILINGDNLQNLIVSMKSDDSEFSTNVSTLNSSMLITSNTEEDISVMIDTDNNGDFDTSINDTQSYTVTFDANEGTVSVGSANTDHTGKLIEVPTAEREGYSFVGWFTDTENGTEITVQTVFEENTVVYARWEKIVTDEETDEETDSIITSPDSTENSDESGNISMIIDFINSIADKFGVTSNQLLMIAGGSLAALVLLMIVIAAIKRKRR